MKRTAKVVAVIVVVALVVPTMLALAASNTKFDITGVWKNPTGQTLQLFQEKDQLNGVFVNAGWAHRMEGRYVSPTKVKLVLIRRTRPNTCEMTMTVDITVNSANSIVMKADAAETACGISGPGSPVQYTRVL